jgi:GT2 family glycosyltransferase
MRRRLTSPAPKQSSLATDKNDFQKDFTIVLAHRGPWMGLWATIHSCEMALLEGSFDYNYVIVINGEDKLPSDMTKCFDKLTVSGKIRQIVIHPKPLSPPSARQLGTIFADGKYLFFFDNHCLVMPDYFKRAISQMLEKKIEVLHSSMRFCADDGASYDYALALDKNFWSNRLYTTPQNLTEPYRIAMSGHGGFIVRRDTWKEVGGYWDGFVGYAGEESYFDLKLWLLGKEVWIDPQLIHYHFCGERTYKRHFTDDFYRNLLAVANMIGGEKWMYTVYENFLGWTKAKGEKSMFDLLIDAANRSNKHAQEIKARRVRTLEETLEHFKAENISH